VVFFGSLMEKSRVV